MPISSIALVGASAALAVAVFKDKDSRIKEAIDFMKISQHEAKSSTHYTIIKNDINSYITGIKDNSFHTPLLDIMARENKSIGYFCKLEGRLESNGPYNLRIKKMSFIQSVKCSFVSKLGSASHFAQMLSFIFCLWIAMLFEQNIGVFEQALSLVLYALSGFMLYNWFTIMALIWKQLPSGVDIKEYSLLFDKYALDKQKETFSTSIPCPLCASNSRC
ncbi:hypothetical protein [Enterobacter ludwigii]|jgi:hypothetical protein|uniref:hypothetical protein n=1 Tax=Enterobacter ludwigii TaxID=299767 RepID=UPI00288ACC09|nr:hypothetical protein [Enterobacter ludwigii]WNI77508.1 hypothetical protein RIK61_05030 [Enterobacter ludwigii]